MKKSFIKRMMSVLAVFVVVTITLAACGSGGDSAIKNGKSSEEETNANLNESDSNKDVETIKIAAFYNMTGANADTGIRDKEGTDLAVKYINDNGGIKSLGGAKLEIVYGDMLSDVSQVKAVTERVLNDEKIVAAVGVGGSAYAAPQLPILEKAKLPYVLFGTAYNLTEQGYNYLFRWSPYGGEGGTFTKTQVEFLQYLDEDLGFDTTKVGIVYENSDFGISLAEGNKALVEAAGFDVVYEESYPIGLTDASSLVANLKNSGAEAVFISSFPQELKLIMNGMKSINYSPAVIGGGGGFLFPEFATSMGDDVVGITSVSILNWDTQTMQASDYKDVPQTYLDTYGAFMCEHSLCSYTNIIILADALERAGSTDGEALKDALNETNLLTPQASGPITFNEIGNNPDAVPVIVQWQKMEDGTLIPVSIYPENEAAGEYIPVG